MREVYRLVRRVAPTDLTVLIEGETGTGKELVARAVHSLSCRADGPIVDINCAAIPESLVESELFGCEKGAFTGAQPRRGLLEVADGGTVFLDEACSLRPATQAKLLRALERREFWRVGGRTLVRSDFRLVVAVSRPVADLLGCGDYRPDFAYRVATVTVSLPPLRSRGSDIRLLAETFLNQASHSGGVARRWHMDALSALQRHEWPGNVRELQSVVHRIRALTDHDILGLDDLMLTPRGSKVESEGATIRARQGTRDRLPPTREQLLASLAANRGVVSRAARALGMERRSLYRLMQAQGLDLEFFRQ